ncbi:MAG: D-cysteine desulfhydrase family protein [Acidobacteriota bacterium]|nr:D-cysteine desulfhydrase family protein [Acidobacteriota bacterium]
MPSSAVRRVQSALARQPRLPLAQLPTPIHDAIRLREALGGPGRCPRILIKRDDLTALGLGGNKARKLEYLVADAQAQGATTLITTGAVQSNHARMTAAAACVAGMRSVLVLTTRMDEAKVRLPPSPQDGFGETRKPDATPVPALEGNLLLDHLYGATVRLVPSVDPMLAVGQDEAVVAEVVAEEESHGRRPYVIPVGGSSGIGVLGYVGGTAELVEQLAAMAVAPSRLYYASGSRGTQAGLTLGARLCEAPYRVYGVAVSAGEPEKIERAKRIANEAAATLELPERLELSELTTDQAFIGDGYGIPTSGGLEAIDLLARSEAILLDPCYTAKGMAALIAHVRDGSLPAGETVVFLHTGGMPALFTQEFSSRVSAGDRATPGGFGSSRPALPS